MKLSRHWIPRALTALLLAGCAQDTSPEDALPELPPVSEHLPPLPSAPGELLASQQQRVMAPSVPAEELAAVVAGNTDFGADLYRHSVRRGENLFFSPYSITQALAMTYAGARGTTEAQMGQALRFTLPQQQLHPALNALDQTLHGRATAPKDKEGKPPQLRVLNATWGQRGLGFEPGWLDTLALHYGAGMRTVDFLTQAEPVRALINTWAEQSTAGRIRGLLPEGSVTEDSRLVLANALYFQGAWAWPFEPRRTESAAFYPLEGGEQQVQMMRGGGMSLPRMKGDGFEAVALPYSGQSFRMLLVLPDSGRFADVEARLSAAFLGELRAKLASRHTALQLPKFRVETQLPLVETMRALGMVNAFTAAADLSGMTREARLAITDIQHKAFVAVDEAGTEAAAATGVVAGPVSVPETLVVNRPFLFLIEDVDTQAVLFLGRVVKP
jgi:serpin B